MKTKGYLTKNFEIEFEKAVTITSLQELFERMMIERQRWTQDGGQFATSNPSSGGHPYSLLDEQMGIVKWELNKLEKSQSRGRFRAYYAFLKMLDEHYPYKTPLLRYKYILEDGVNTFKKEILSNMIHISGEVRTSYLVKMRDEMEALMKNVYATEKTLDEWCRKYNTSEKEIFAPVASERRNRIYDVLKTPGISANAEVLSCEDEMATDEYDIQNDFYNVFYGRAMTELIELLEKQMKLYGEEKFIARQGAVVPKGEELKELEDLFYDKSHAEICMNILREHEYPLVGDYYNYIGKLKGGLCVWITELERQSIIRHQPDEVIAALLRKRFSGLAPFNSSLFRKPNDKAEKRYSAHFRSKIERLKNKR